MKKKWRKMFGWFMVKMFNSTEFSNIICCKRTVFQGHLTPAVLCTQFSFFTCNIWYIMLAAYSIQHFSNQPSVWLLIISGSDEKKKFRKKFFIALVLLVVENIYKSHSVNWKVSSQQCEICVYSFSSVQKLNIRN